MRTEHSPGHWGEQTKPPCKGQTMDNIRGGCELSWGSNVKGFMPNPGHPAKSAAGRLKTSLWQSASRFERSNLDRTQVALELLSDSHLLGGGQTREWQQLLAGLFILSKQMPRDSPEIYWRACSIRIGLPICAA